MDSCLKIHVRHSATEQSSLVWDSPPSMLVKGKTTFWDVLLSRVPKLVLLCTLKEVVLMATYWV